VPGACPTASAAHSHASVIGLSALRFICLSAIRYGLPSLLTMVSGLNELNQLCFLVAGRIVLGKELW
jgi:hypothetical protein